MKTIKRLTLSNDPIHLVDVNIQLELNACGRGFITAQTEVDYSGKMVRLDVGYDGLVLRWFTGYVERSQPAENGYQRLFVRELIGVFEKMMPCSFQHPTLRDLLAWLTEESGLAFTTPAGAEYADCPIPHFTHNGTGYQLLAALGRAFSIPDYQWYQLPDGSVYTGAAADGMFAGKPVAIPAEFSLCTAAGNSMTLPLIQSLRPGSEVNGHRLTHVRLCNDNIEIKWGAKNPMQRQIEIAFPELAAGLHLPKFARVEAPSEDVSSGNVSDPFRPRYAVDLQLLDGDGNPAANTPVYSAVPLPVPMAGSESGMFQFPPPGTLVEVGFTDGRPDKPFVRQSMPQGHNLPAVKPGEQLQQQREGVSQRVTVAGDWQRQTDQSITESSMKREIHSDEEQRRTVVRETTVQATDTLTVIGTSKLLAGAVVHISEGDYSAATGGNLNIRASKNHSVSVGQKVEIEVGQTLTEKITGIRRSVAAAHQIIGPVFTIGNGEINLLSLLTDTLDVVNELANLAASHTHPNTGQSGLAENFTATAKKTRDLRTKYQSLIEG